MRWGGYVESYYEWNFHRPANGLQHHRAYDTHHNVFALQNAELTADARAGRGRLQIAVQSGSLPENSASSLGPPVPHTAEPQAWQRVKEAVAGIEAPLGTGLVLEGGVMQWPMGLEGASVHEDWSWSKSNLYVAMPWRMAGVRVSYPAAGRWRAAAGVFNGWTGALENNREKTASAGIRYEERGLVVIGARYTGGVERNPDAVEGRAWRHAISAFGQAQATEEIALRLEGNAGLEGGAFGRTWWAAAAIHVRARIVEPLYFAARVDGIRQVVGKNERGTAEPVLFAGPGVASGTMTAEVALEEGMSVRVEYRHDQGGSPQFFRGEVLGTGSEESPYEPNSYSQRTLLAGVTAWF